MRENTVFHVGNTVRFKFGPNRASGVIKEDRGPIGIGGRRLYLIQFSLEPGFPFLIELPASELELVDKAVLLP